MRWSGCKWDRIPGVTRGRKGDMNVGQTIGGKRFERRARDIAAGAYVGTAQLLYSGKED